MLSIDRWLPRQLTGVEDRWQALQARVFVILLALFVLPVVPAAFILTTVSLLDIANLWILANVSTFTSFGILICYGYFQRNGSLLICSAIYGVLALLMVTAVAFQTGGWKSPMCIFLLTLPVLVSLVMDLRSAILYAILVLAVYIFMFLLHNIEYPFPQVVAEQYLHGTRSAIWILTLLSLFASLLLYDFSEKNLTASLAMDRLQLERFAHHDPLTGLFNEQALFERDEKREGQSSTRMLAYVSVENIQPISNHFGFEVADQFVVEVVKRLHQEVPDRWMIARYGGQGFVITQENCREEDIARLNGVVYRLRQWNRQPVLLPNGFRFLLDVQVGTSITENPEVSISHLIDDARGSMSRDYAR